MNEEEVGRRWRGLDGEYSHQAAVARQASTPPSAAWAARTRASGRGGVATRERSWVRPRHGVSTSMSRLLGCGSKRRASQHRRHPRPTAWLVDSLAPGRTLHPR